jgi:hypothetical protein
MMITKRHGILVGVLLIVGCSKGPTTEPGPLGEETNLLGKLPPTLAVPERSALKSNVETFDVCPDIIKAGPPVEEKPNSRAKVEVRWKSWTTPDGAAYVASFEVELKKGVSGLSMRLGDNAVEDINRYKDGARPLEEVRIHLRCTRTFHKTVLDDLDEVRVYGDGKSTHPKRR